MFYPNEIYKTNIETIQHIDCIYAHCYVIHRKYYLTERPILYSENDVFLCQTHYNDKTNHLRKFKPFRCQFNSHPHIIHDEIVTFPDNEHLVIHKIPSPYLVREVLKINNKRNSSTTTSTTCTTITNASSSNNTKNTNGKQHHNSTSTYNKNSISTNLDSPFKPKTKYNNNIDDNNNNNSTITTNSDTHTISCQWNKCQIVFDNINELIQHLFDPTIHFIKDLQQLDRFCCLWKGCFKSKRSHTLNYFDDPNKLTIHICHIHLNYYNQLPNVTLPLSSKNVPIYDNPANNGIKKLIPSDHQKNMYTNNIVTVDNSTEFYNLLFPYLTNMNQAIQQVNSHIRTLNTQVMNMNMIIHEQSQELKHLKQTQTSHQCCSQIINNCNSLISNGSSIDYHNTTFFESASADIIRYALQQHYDDDDDDDKSNNNVNSNIITSNNLSHNKDN